MGGQKLVGVIHELTMGGAERMMVNILNHFSNRGDEVHLIIFKNIGTLKGLLNPAIKLHDLKSDSVKKGLPNCLRAIHTIQPNILFSGIGHLNIALAPFIPLMRLLLPQTRWISRETNIVSLQNEEEKYPKLFDYLYHKTYKNFDAIIAQSQDMKDDLELNYPATASKISLINNPIDIERVEVLGEEPLGYAFEEGVVRLVSVGTLRERKRQDLLLETMALLPQNYHLVVVGSGAEEQKLKALTKKLNLEERVTFEGHQTNPYPYMRMADLFILTSEHEGFPNVLLESNSLGTPVVAFACLGGIKEIVEEGINGFTVTNGDVAGLALTIKEAVKRGFDKSLVIDSVERRYSKDIILKRYENIFYSREVEDG
jgi:glycosyltransferase involved in cell wall biosynthesis